jgi:hypothetical protein
MKFALTLLLGLTLATGSLQAQDSRPAVFQLGENEKIYEELKQEYSQTLLEVNNFDTQAAFNNWLSMLIEMEKYADKLRFDLKGAKLWLHVFWNPDGTISNIGYLPRPDSRYLVPAELGAFFKSFMKKYQFPLSSGKKFSHYTGANFPVYSEKVNN